MKIKAFVLHATFMDIRKEHIVKLMQKLSESTVFSLDYEFVDGYEASTITQEDVKTKINLTKANNNEFFDNLVRNMHINQISNSLKHGHAIEKAAEVASLYDFFLFLEDDVLFGDDVTERLRATCELLGTTDNVDLLFLGFPSLTPIEDKEKVLFRPTSDFYKLFPCCDSYLIKSNKIEKFSSTYFPAKYITNFHLSYLCQTNGLNSSMVVPNVFLDGSKYGAYLSSIDPNNKLLFNPEFIQLANMVQNYKPEDEKNIVIAIDNMKFKNHPDVMHLHAIYLMTKGEYKKAQAILESVYDITTQNGCIVNNETDFLRTFMRLHRFIQE